MPFARRALLPLFAGLLIGAFAGTVQAQTALRIQVGAAPGGSIDVYSRIVADHMAKTLGRPVIVETKPGANGNVAAAYVVEQPADGSVLWAGTQSMTEINPLVYKNLRWKLSDFTPLIKGIEAPMVLATNPGVPAKTLAELVAWIKANPGKVSYASYSPGTPSHFICIQMNERLGLDMAHVPYRGGAPQVVDLLGGNVHLGITQIQGSMEHIRAGKLNAIVTTGEQRSRFFPDTPTFAELGYPEFSASIWFGLLVKAGTPPDVVEKLLAAAKAAHADPGIRAKLEEQGFDVSGQSGPALKASIEAQSERWAKIVKQTGFSAD